MVDGINSSYPVNPMDKRLPEAEPIKKKKGLYEENNEDIYDIELEIKEKSAEQPEIDHLLRKCESLLGCSKGCSDLLCSIKCP